MKHDAQNSEHEKICFKQVICTACHRQAFLSLDLCSTCISESNIWCTNHFCVSHRAICNHSLYCSAISEQITPEQVQETIEKLKLLLKKLGFAKTGTKLGSKSEKSYTGKETAASNRNRRLKWPRNNSTGILMETVDRSSLSLTITKSQTVQHEGSVKHERVALR